MRYVLDMLMSSEKASGPYVPYQIVDRRTGDVAKCYTNPDFAFKTLGWNSEFGVERMFEDTRRWQSQNLNGYDK